MDHLKQLHHMDLQRGVLNQIRFDAADTEMRNLCAVCTIVLVLLGNEFYVETFTTELILAVSHTTVGYKLYLRVRSFITTSRIKAST